MQLIFNSTEKSRIYNSKAMREEGFRLLFDGDYSSYNFVYDSVFLVEATLRASCEKTGVFRFDVFLKREGKANKKVSSFSRAISRK